MPHQTYSPAQGSAQDQPEPGDVHSRYRTLEGAQVVMTFHDTYGHLGEHRYMWECTGCKERPASPEYIHASRSNANRHAGTCRAMPPGRPA